MVRKQKRTKFGSYYKSNLNIILFRWIDIRKIRLIKKEIKSLGPDAKIIDVGAGSGNISHALYKSGFKNITCCDNDPKLLNICSRNGLDAKKIDFDKKLPFTDGHFDCLIMIDAIEHVKEPHKVIQDLKRIVKKGGKLILFTPPYDSVRWILAERFHNFITRRKSDHISPFTDESLRYLVADNFKKFRIGRTNFNLSMYAIITKD